MLLHNTRLLLIYKDDLCTSFLIILHFFADNGDHYSMKPETLLCDFWQTKSYGHTGYDMTEQHYCFLLLLIVNACAIHGNANTN